VAELIDTVRSKHQANRKFSFRFDSSVPNNNNLHRMSRLVVRLRSMLELMSQQEVFHGNPPPFVPGAIIHVPPPAVLTTAMVRNP